MICLFFFFFQAEDGIRDLVRSRGLGDVYKRQSIPCFYFSSIFCSEIDSFEREAWLFVNGRFRKLWAGKQSPCFLKHIFF